MDPYFLRLREANLLLTEYNSNSAVQNEVNSTFRYKGRNVFLYIQVLTSFSPTYLGFYNTAFARSSDTLGHRVSPYELLPNQISEFLTKCERSSGIRERLRVVVTDQTPEKPQMTQEQYRQMLQQQYEQEQQQLGIPMLPGIPKTKVGPEGDTTQEDTEKLKDSAAINTLTANLNILVNAYKTKGSFDEAELAEFPVPSSYLEALIAEGLLNRPDYPEALKQWEEKLQQLAEKLHKGEYKVDQEKYQEARNKLQTPPPSPSQQTTTTPLTPIPRPLTPLTRLQADAKRVRQLLKSKPKTEGSDQPTSPRVAPSITPPVPNPIQNVASQAGIAIQKATRKPNLMTSFVGGAIGAAIGGARGGIGGAFTGAVAGAIAGAAAPTLIQQFTTPSTIIQSQPQEQQTEQEPQSTGPQGSTPPTISTPKIPFLKKPWFWFVIIIILVFLLPIFFSMFKTSSLCPPWETACGKVSSNPSTVVGDYSIEVTKSGQEKVDNRQQITYEITVILRGPGAAEIEVTDLIPENATFISGTESPNLLGRKLTWKIPRLGPAQPKKVTFTVEPRTEETWNDDVWMVNQAEARILQVFGGGSGVSPVGPVSGLGCPDTSGNRSADSCKYLNPSINIFDTTITPAGIEAYVTAYSPRFINGGKGDLAEFRRRVDYIIKKSQEAGLNPALALGLWKSENAFGTTGSREMGCAGVGFYEEVHCALGIEEFSNPVKNPIPNCARSKDANSVACKALKELRAKEYERIRPISYPVATFDDFMESHGPYGHFTNGQPTNCMHSYNVILEVAKEVGACKVTSTPNPGTQPQPFPQNPGNLGITVSCPLNASNVTISCGTAANPAGGCGHGGPPPLYRACTTPLYASCPNGGHSEALKHALDLTAGGAASGPVFMPYLNGDKKVTWKLVKGPTAIDGGGWGYRVDYETELEGKKILIDLTHLQPLQPPGTIFSGDQIGTYMAGEVRHLHAAVSINGTWVEPKDILMCTQ